MEWWKLILGLFGIMGTVYTGLHVYFKNKKDTKIESFKTIMEESKKFRDEIRIELKEAKDEIAALRVKIKEYEEKIDVLSDRLKSALQPRSWLYFYIQKPIRQTEIEELIRFHVGDSTSERILVVDDDPYTQKILDEINKTNNWSIIRARSGKVAIETLKLVTPKLIIIDLALPVSDGFDVFNTLHENKDYSTIPLVIISSGNLKEVDRIFVHTKINESLIKA